MLNTVLGADIELLKVPRQLRVPKTLYFNVDESAALETEISKLLAKGVIVPCDREKGDYVSTIFLRPKKDGSYRLILNLRSLNKNLQYSHFKMESLHAALDLITPDCYMASIDLKDAYYSVPIRAEFWKYLKFEYNNTFYSFTSLPNGLSPAPRIFTKLCKPIYSELRKNGFLNCPYIDDSLLVAATPEQCRLNVINTVKAFRDTGFTIHPTKSVFQPCQEIQFIGFVINSRTMTISLPSSKVSDILAQCKKLTTCPTPTIMHVAKVIGKLVAPLPAVPYGHLHYRLLDIEKANALKRHKGNFDAEMRLSGTALSDLRWWLANLGHVTKTIGPLAPVKCLQSDASNSGWGGVDMSTGITTGGQWSLHEASLHINEKEILGAFLTLQCFASTLRSCHVQIQIDNTVAVAYVNNQGGQEI